MAEYIEREAAIDALQNHYEYRNAVQNGTMDECVMLMTRVPAADVVPVVRCGECKLYGGRPWENGKTGICARTDIGVVHDDFCSYGMRKDGDANVQNWEKNHLRPTNMSGTKCEPCKPIIFIPPHGRLIDADALPWEKQGLMLTDPDEWGIETRYIEAAPTIIPASEEGAKTKEDTEPWLCLSCRHYPPSSTDGKPCTQCNPSEVWHSCYDPAEEGK